MSVKMKSINLTIPVVRSTNTQSLDKISSVRSKNQHQDDLIQRFLIKDNKEVKDIENKDLSNAVTNLMKVFKVKDYQNLPHEKPLSELNPLQYMTQNDLSLKKMMMRNLETDDGVLNSNIRGRLSVTKLLTKQWCELRTYYDIYSNVTPKETASMAQGTKHHLSLELKTHKPIEVEQLTGALESVQLQIQKDIDAPDKTEAEKAPSIHNLDLFFGRDEENELAHSWLKDIISKIYTLLKDGEAREVLAHGYLNFDTQRFAEAQINTTLDKERDVLVSGIIDHLILEESSIGEHIKSFFAIDESCHGIKKFNLSEFISYIGQLNDSNIHKDKIKVSDVKTRSGKTLPDQESVLLGARLQVAYYRKMLDILSQDPNFTYQLLLENATRRGLNIDRPIGVKKALELLGMYGELVIDDWRILATGGNIGFESYDNESIHDAYYDMSMLKDMETEEFKEEWTDFADTGIFKRWEKPLTLRYFAARAAQMYHLLNPILGVETSVVYHNTKTGDIIDSLEYKYQEELVNESLASSVTFWNGTRKPEMSDSLYKCRFCIFKRKCSRVAPEKSLSLRDELYKFLELE